MTHLLLGLALAVGAPGPKDKEKEKSPQKLDGTWVVEKIEGKGDNPPKDAGQVTFTFADGKVSIQEGTKERVEKAAYTADATQKPARVDLKPDRGGKTGEPGTHDMDRARHQMIA